MLQTINIIWNTERIEKEIIQLWWKIDWGSEKINQYNSCYEIFYKRVIFHCIIFMKMQKQTEGIGFNTMNCFNCNVQRERERERERERRMYKFNLETLYKLMLSIKHSINDFCAYINNLPTCEGRLKWTFCWYSKKYLSIYAVEDIFLIRDNEK